MQVSLLPDTDILVVIFGVGAWSLQGGQLKAAHDDERSAARGNANFPIRIPMPLM
jgi:hypothetical protein